MEEEEEEEAVGGARGGEDLYADDINFHHCQQFRISAIVHEKRGVVGFSKTRRRDSSHGIAQWMRELAGDVSKPQLKVVHASSKSLAASKPKGPDAAVGVSSRPSAAGVLTNGARPGAPLRGSASQPALHARGGSSPAPTQHRQRRGPGSAQHRPDITRPSTWARK